MKTPAITPEQRLAAMTSDQRAHTLFNGVKQQALESIFNYSGSKIQLQRVLAAIVLSPLDEDKKWSYPEEKELFTLIDAILEHKVDVAMKAMEDAGIITVAQDKLAALTMKEEGK